MNNRETTEDEQIGALEAAHRALRDVNWDPYSEDYESNGAASGELRPEPQHFMAPPLPSGDEAPSPQSVTNYAAQQLQRGPPVGYGRPSFYDAIDMVPSEASDFSIYSEDLTLSELGESVSEAPSVSMFRSPWGFLGRMAPTSRRGQSGLGPPLVSPVPAREGTLGLPERLPNGRPREAQRQQPELMHSAGLWADDDALSVVSSMPRSASRTSGGRRRQHILRTC